MTEENNSIEDKEDKEPVTGIKVAVSLVDEMWPLRGRKGTYTKLIRSWQAKANSYDELKAAATFAEKAQAEKEKALKAELAKVKTLVKKLGSPELVAAIKEASKEPETKEG